MRVHNVAKSRGSTCPVPIADDTTVCWMGLYTICEPCDLVFDLITVQVLGT